MGLNKYLLRMFVFSGFLSAGLIALPTGPQVISGGVDIQTVKSNTLSISSTSKRSIVNWDTFSNQLGEIIRIQMPEKSSAILNRVTGNLPSELMGMLTSNGHVYLINQNGILFGKHANVRVGELTASTLDFSDQMFLSGNDLKFSGDSTCSVINQGQIMATEGDVCFIGPSVINEGTLTCPNGCAALLAGKKIIVKPDKERIVICLEEAKNTDVGAVQAGSIHARRAEIIADGNLYSLAIKHTGMTNATRFENYGGRIRLYAENGNAELSQSSRIISHHDDGAGEVQILGKDINIKDQTFIDVSGNNQAGKIFIGGGYRGRGLLEAETVCIGKDVRLLSDAKVTGNGGQIVVWSNGQTKFDGFASVRGGWTSGDGGLIEISGAHLDYHGNVDAKAMMGKTGTLLWDPSNITIGPGTSSNISTNGAGSVTITGTADSAHLNITDLNTALASANVIVSTASAFAYDGDISLTDDITINSNGNNLTWNADGDVNLGFNITFVDSTDAATFTINPSGDFNVTSASVIQFEGNALNCTVGGNANFLADFTFTDTSGVNASTFSLNAAGSVTVDGTLTAQNANLFKLESSGLMTLKKPMTTTNTTTVTLKTNQQYGELLIKPGATISTDANLLTIESADNVFIQDSVTNSTSGNISLISQKDLTIASTTAASIVGTASGDLTVTASDGLSVAGGSHANACAQLGSTASTVNSDITISVGSSIILSGGSSSEKCFALIGHGTLDSDGGSRTGDINITSVGTDLLLLGGSAVDAFAQIGHLNGSTANGATITGDISNGAYGPVAIPQVLLIQGGLGQGSYALFGHGGGVSSSPDTYSGSIQAQANIVNIYAGTNNQQGAFAAYGFYVDGLTGTGQVGITSPLIALTADFSCVVQSQSNANASLGARVITNPTTSADINVTQMNFTTDWLAMQGGVNQLNPNEVFLGVFAGEQSSLASANPATSAVSNLDITVNQSLKLIVSNISTNTDVQGLITNGSVGSGSGYTLNCTVGGETFICSGNSHAVLRSIDVLNLASGTTVANKDIVLQARSEGAVYIDCQNLSGASSVSSGNDILLSANNSANPAFIQVSDVTSTQPLIVTADQTINIGANSYIEHKGSGDLTLVVDNAFPTVPYRGEGAFKLASTAHVGRSGGGSLRIFSSERAFNTTNGINNFNGNTFVPGPIFVDSQTERWGVYYPDAFIGTDTYTLFYKNES